MLNLLNLLNMLAIELFKKDNWSWNRISLLIFLFSCILIFNSSVTLFNVPSNCLYNGLESFSIVFISSTNSSVNNITPIKSYGNADLQKQDILNENKGKSGVYLWTNTLNGKTYIGSAEDLKRRLSRYYQFPQLVRSNMIIYKAILKYGHLNFSLDILEYCDKKDCIKKEQCFIDLLQPEYNLSPIAGSSSGRLVSVETKKKMSDAHKGRYKGEDNNNFGKITSVETKERISIAKGTKVYVFSLKLELLFTFPSYSIAAKHFNNDKSTIIKYARSNNIFRNEFILSLEPLPSDFQFINNVHSLTCVRDSITIYLYSLDYQLLEIYSSATQAAKVLNISHPIVLKYARSGKIYKDQYIISLKELSSSLD